MKYLPNLNRSALITAILFTVIEVTTWAVRTYVPDIELTTILNAGILSIGIALGVVSDSRKKKV